MLALLITVGLAFLVSCLATRALLGLLRRASVIDHPNDRSSHEVPTPRGGGLAVIVTVVGAAFAWSVAEGTTSDGLGIVLGLSIALSVLSFIDDLRDLSAGIRIASHALAVAGGLWALGGAGAFAAYLPQPLDLALTGLAWLWFINLYNFMDGIDGIDGSEAVCVSVGVVGLVLFGMAPAGLLGPAAAVAGAALGFLVWNWHRAKVFLGDSGSVPLGYLIGYLLIVSAQPGGGALAAALVLPLVFVVDASVTLLRRIARGERPTEAHREHAYQRAVQGGWSHDRVCLAVISANAALIAVAWFVAPWQPWIGLALGLCIAGLTYRGFHAVGNRRERAG
ncbi:MAG: glycosyltransferase family 4 protein [Alphaproteobacteria bacterium]|nr:glycosyltransferase family 4 protein [Alphaproteobacteria bacterium]